MTPVIATLSAFACTVVLTLTLGLTSSRRGELLEITSLGMVQSYALLLLIAAAYAVGQWRGSRWLALAPMAILLAGIPGIPRVRDADRALTDQSFRRHFPAFESAVGRMTLAPGEFVRPQPGDLPATPLCCYRALVRRSSADELSALFLVRPRLAYLYDPTETAWSDGVSARWRDRTAVGAHWYRLAR